MQKSFRVLVSCIKEPLSIGISYSYIQKWIAKTKKSTLWKIFLFKWHKTRECTGVSFNIGSASFSSRSSAKKKISSAITVISINRSNNLLQKKFFQFISFTSIYYFYFLPSLSSSLSLSLSLSLFSSLLNKSPSSFCELSAD